MVASQLRHNSRPSFWGCFLYAVLISATTGTNAQAQAPPQAEIGKWDVGVAVGYLAVQPEVDFVDRYADRWYSAGQVGVLAGHYFTPNLKAEVELSTSSEGRQWIQRQLPIPGAQFPPFQIIERFNRLREVSGAFVYQFFDNQVVHPFLMLGVAADFDRVRSYAPRQTIVVDPRVQGAPVVVIPEVREGPETMTSARLLVGGGAKMYFSPNAFVRTDSRFATDGSGHHITFRIGLGLDF